MKTHDQCPFEPAVNFYRGVMTRDQGLRRLERLARRLVIDPAAVRVRRIEGSPGMSLSFPFQGVEIVRSCKSQGTVDGNFMCLVLWLTDLVRNIERAIETPAEAFHAEGGNLLGVGTPATASLLSGRSSTHLYRGVMSIDDALATIERCLPRIGLCRDDVAVRWDARGNSARLRMRLPSGGVVEKVSRGQVDVRANVAALALWLQGRCRSVERGIEQDLGRLFSAYLLAASGA